MAADRSGNSPVSPAQALGPPPAYSVTLEESETRQPERPHFGGGGIIPTLALLERRCQDPCSRRWRGCCRSCAITLLVDITLMILQFLTSVVTIIAMTKRPGWKEGPIITAIFSTLLACIRTTSAMSKILALIGRVSQTISLMASVAFYEMYIEGPRDDNGELERSAITNSLEVLSVVCLSLSSATGALCTSANADCLWTATRKVWDIVVLITLILSALMIVAMVEVSEHAMRQILSGCAIVSLVIALRDSADSVLKTCVYRNHRFLTVGTRRPLGRAKCRIARTESDTFLYEDDVSSVTSAGLGMCELFACMLLVLAIPGMYAAVRVWTEKACRMSYAGTALTAFSSAIVGAFLALGIEPEMWRGQNMNDTTIMRLSVAVIILFGLILLATQLLVGPILYTIGTSIATTLTMASLRFGGTGIRLLSTACLGKMTLCALILSCACAYPAAYSVDQRY